MGYIQYGHSATQITFDDRTLAHLQVVLTAKLRRGEGFFFTWLDDPALGDGRSSIWMSTNIPLFFHYSETSRHDLNKEWLDLLNATANSAGGLFLANEPGQVTPRPQPTGIVNPKMNAKTSVHVATASATSKKL